MKLTPLDIRHKEFKRGMRGYTEADVDEFLDNVADEFERVFKENIELSERLDALQEQINHYRNIEETLQKTLVSAQQTAEGVKASAEKESQLILRDADMRARDLVSEAERKARDLTNEAYMTKQAVEKETVVLQNAEADFRFKFRQLLEGYLKQIGAFDVSARDRAGEFARRVEELKGAIASGGATEETPMAAVAPPAAEVATPQRAETVVALPVQPVVAASAPAVAPAPEPSDPEPAPAPVAAAEPREAEAATVTQPQPRPSQPHVERPWWEPIPPEGEEPEDEPAAATPLIHDADEDTTALDGSADEEPAGAAEKPPERSRFAEDDEFLSDVDDTVGDNEFKW
jgi:cell division initiation protein